MMKIYIALCIATAILLMSCSPSVILDVPEWPNGGIISQTYRLSAEQESRLEGVFYVQSGKEYFGDSVAIKVSGNRLTVYSGVKIGYIVLQTGYLDSVVFTEGYWRHQADDGTGLCRLTVSRDSGGRYAISGDPAFGKGIRYVGSIGLSDGTVVPINLVHARDFSEASKKKLYNIAHRGGGRTADRIPYSENTTELLLIAEHFGANAVEIDIRLSSDRITYLYHDKELNPRLTNRSGLIGASESYPYAALLNYVRLIGGEQIPKFRDAMLAVATQTNVEFVYLDTKSEDVEIIKEMLPIVQEAREAAAAIPGRAPFELYVGMPTQAVYDEFVAIPGHENIPSLCELSEEQTTAANSKVWGPRWTLGTQPDAVARMHAQGRLCVTWTLDLDEFVKEFVNNSDFDGILTNYPTLIRYHQLMK